MTQDNPPFGPINAGFNLLYSPFLSQLGSHLTYYITPLPIFFLKYLVSVVLSVLDYLLQQILIHHFKQPV
jgi:hypothetical protein